MERIHYIDIDWPDLFKPIMMAKPGFYNRIRINREVIPIVFVPGIMGSRLKNNRSGHPVWDPDSEVMCMLLKYGGAWNTPAQRKRMLIGQAFDPDFLEVDERNGRHNEKVNTFLDPWRADRGWGGVYWGSYGEFLEKLQNHKWDAPLSSKGKEKAKEAVGKCFEFPVHAFGYNWTDTNFNSGRKLAARIAEIKGWYRSKGRLCKFVILVTHSMGGLVARSACILHHAESNVLGVIHGVQPATGAPAAYWRMKAGFERTGTTMAGRLASKASAWVLGTNGEEVTCILGNAPGGLELLPNCHYTDNEGNRGWLHLPGAGGMESVLPRRGNPYDEIYKVKNNKYWRLIDPDWLAPKGNQSRAQSLNYKNDPWTKFVTCIGMAEGFHSKLRVQSHCSTYQFYSGDLNTPHFVRFNRKKASYVTREMPTAFGYPATVETTEPVTKESSRGSSVMYADTFDRQVKGPFTDRSATDVLTMSQADEWRGGGDGTVPESSGKAISAVIQTFQLKGIEHQEAYCETKAIEYVMTAIRNLALKRIKEGETDSAR